jgi:hypothetical protein
MDTMRLVFSLLVVSITVSSVQALEWVEYEGTIPENAVSVNEGTEDRPVCRRNSRIGIVNDSGRCRSVRIGGEIEGKREFEILVDNTEAYSEIDVSGYEEEIAVLRAETEDLQNALAQSTDGMVTQADFDAGLEEAVASATEDMVTQADFDAAVAEAAASATEGMVTQADFDTAVEEAAASATEGMVTQADFDAGLEEAVASATEGMVTQADFDAAVAEAAASATEGMVTQADFDTAVEEAAASATEGMVTQADFDAGLEEAVASATEGMVTQADFDAAVAEAAASATEGMVTQADFDTAVEEAAASATEGMVTQADFDAAVAEAAASATEGMVTQADFDTAVEAAAASATDGSFISAAAMQEALTSLTDDSLCSPNEACLSLTIWQDFEEIIAEGAVLTAEDIIKHNNFWNSAAKGYPTNPTSRSNTAWATALKSRGVNPYLAITMGNYAFFGSINNNSWCNN